MKQFKSSKDTIKIQEDEDVLGLPEKFLGYTQYNKQLEHIVFDLDEEIQSAKYYRHVCNKLLELGEDDTVDINICSGGGDLEGFLVLYDALNKTQADVTANVKGFCDSAASMIALSCPNISVSPYATMLVHFVEFGLPRDRASDIRKRVNHLNDFCYELFCDVYVGFLTEDEIKACVHDGKQMLMQYDEIVERLESRATMLNGLTKEANENFNSKQQGLTD